MSRSYPHLIDLFKAIVVDDTFDSDYTIEDATMLIEDAKCRGYAVPDKLTPQLYIQLYNSFKKPRTPEYIMSICKDRVVNCICDGVDTIEVAADYLKDMKLSGYAVPSMLTPELFVKLYKELEEED